jgi:UDP-2-acetamido-3-amino-2,3-dideoxy-glucuronate N-acetyltransferase
MSGVLVVGAGQWGRNLVRNFHELGALRAVCEASADLRAGLAADYPGLRLYEDLERALAEGGFAGVVVATPVMTHYAVARQALQAGYPVLVEKPLATRTEEAAELAGLARERGLTLMVGHLPLFLPAYEALRQVVTSGELGHLLYLHARRVNLGRVRPEENVLWSLAPHDVAMMIDLTGRLPEEVHCGGGAWLQEGIEDLALLEMRFSGGVLGAGHFSWLDPGTERRLSVVGRQGMAVLDETSVECPLWVSDRRYDPERRLTVKGEARCPRLASEPPLLRECRHFLESLARGSAPRSGADLGLAVVAVLEAASESLRRGGEWRKVRSDQFDSRLGPARA